MGWGDSFLKYADNFVDRAVPDNVVRYFAPVLVPAVTKGLGPVIKELETPPVTHRSFQGAAGRHHDNETCIPQGSVDINSDERYVYLACRVVGGGAGDGALGFAHKHAMSIPAAVFPQMSTVPNPTYHWCVTVGDYLHQLQATSLDAGWNYYQNDRMKRISGGWDFHEIGTTKFNDAAIIQASIGVMNNLPERYDILNNNCQHFALGLLDQILRNGRKMRYQMGNGTYGSQAATIMTPDDLDSSKKPGTTISVTEIAPAPKDDGAAEIPVPENKAVHRETLHDAAKIMIANTPNLEKKDVVSMEAEKQ